MNENELRRAPRDTGALLVEYGLLATLIAVVCAVAVTLVGVRVVGLFNVTF